ncbi:Alpha/Beta hydrolase protein [Leptodontidium sp. 2 PMI_412]|nr:Alpha/Beta hydrolase protein [Leptodontidium sp. 2 PMI_412]
MIIEYHVAIPLRNGYKTFADIYRPVDESTKVAPVVAWTPYGKHNPLPIQKVFPTSGIEPSWLSHYAAFEAPDPMYWTKHGYAIVVVNTPGMWLGEGIPTFASGATEALYFYDTIEWVAKLPWSSGKVGTNGVSYLATSQWHVAAVRPPSLGAIIPDEGWSDMYREVVRHGGIPCTSFFPYVLHRWGNSINQMEDFYAEHEAHPFFDAFWETKKAKLENITVPAFVIASFADQGMHTRGTLEGFKKISSKDKYLLVHRRKKWAFYYTPEIVEKQRAFYDKFLKGKTSTQVEKWPKVLMEVGDRYYDGEWRGEVEWPLSRQVLTPLYLDASSGSLSWEPVSKVSSSEYHSLAGGPCNLRSVYDLKFDADTEISGHISARLFMEAAEGNDMDVFVAIYKLDAQDKQVGQTFFGVFEDGPVCLGWMRASRRELDPIRSTPEQPVQLHQRDEKLQPGRVYALDIEILPSSMVYRAGEKMRFIVQGSDIVVMRPKVLSRHERDQVNVGQHTLWTGGDRESRLLVPVIPR